MGNKCIMLKKNKNKLNELDSTKTIKLDHCCICHTNFEKGSIVRCKYKKTCCENHGLYNRVNKNDDNLVCVFKNDNEFCECNYTNDTCISIEEFKKKIDDKEYLKQWLIFIIGNKNHNCMNDKTKLIGVSSDKINRLSMCHYNGEHQCSICINLNSYVIHLIEKYI